MFISVAKTKPEPTRMNLIRRPFADSLKMFTAALALCVSVHAWAQAAPVDAGDAHDGQKLVAIESPAAVSKRLEWWRDARFGMFIHWGLYAQDGCFYKGEDGKTEH